MNQKRKLEGKRVLITGASTGIGKGVALELAEQGAKIIINYYPSADQLENAEKVAHEICHELSGMECENLLIPANVGKEKEVLSLFEQIQDRWDGVDILVNNAGIQRKSPSHELSFDSFMQVMNSNAIGTFLCSREMIKHLLKHKRKGSIINNTSVHQLIPKPQYLSYSMSKGAIQNLTRTLALEYASYGIRVNNVAPGAIITPINPWAHDEEKKREIAQHVPLGVVGEVKQIAKAVLFLASDDSDYMTGQTLFVDGGLTLYPDFSEDWSSS